MNAQQRIDKLKRLAPIRVADDQEVDPYTADKLAAMSDEELERQITHLAKVYEILDQCGALDDVLARSGMTRPDVYPDDYIDPIGTLP